MVNKFLKFDKNKKELLLILSDFSLQFHVIKFFLKLRSPSWTKNELDT